MAASGGLVKHNWDICTQAVKRSLHTHA